jgi:ribonuclease P protein component
LPGRIRGREAFARVVREGRRVSGSLVTVYLRPRGDDQAVRVGFAAGRRLGNAPERNRVRRRLREAVRRWQGCLPRGTDMVWVGRRSVLQAPWEELYREVGRLMVELLGKEEGGSKGSGASG